MRSGAYTPEELETLFEDTLLVRDHQALVGLFEDGALLFTGDGRSACGGEAIALLALAMWEGEHSYVADPRCVVQARDVALIVVERGIHVAHRNNDGVWRYRIVLLSGDETDAVQDDRLASEPAPSDDKRGEHASASGQRRCPLNMPNRRATLRGEAQAGTERNGMDKIDLHEGMTLPQVFFTEWKRYQGQLAQAIAPLTACITAARSR